MRKRKMKHNELYTLETEFEGTQENSHTADLQLGVATEQAG